MQRIVSFVILVALVLVIGFFFFQVMSAFILPMFFAGILVVVFRPLHLRLVQRCRGRVRLAAGLSTLTILAIVLVPLFVLVVRAGMDAYTLAENINARDIDDTIGQLRTRLGLGTPPDDVVNALGQLREDIQYVGSAFDPQRALPAGEKVDDPVAVARSHLEEAHAHLEIVADQVDLYLREFRDTESRSTPWENRDCIYDVEAAHINVEAIVDDLKGLRDELSHGQVSVETTEDALAETRSLQRNLLGGDVSQWFKERTNVDIEQLQDLLYSLAAPSMVVSRASRVGGALAELLIGIVVTVLSLYYFLADGPAMVETVMQLSPLDDRYEQAMLTEFDRISRAVVVATLLSALVQGLLAGVGYYFANLDGVFLLTLLTMMLAMVPFVGAASVWGSCCVYLLLVGQPWHAGILAVYGTLIVSMMDNVIKPVVLHGQSNLHPLLALLSVLGGAKALGPIGIFVGPMVVAFLQAVLNMLKVEMTELEDADQALDVKVSNDDKAARSSDADVSNAAAVDATTGRNDEQHVANDPPD